MCEQRREDVVPPFGLRHEMESNTNTVRTPRPTQTTDKLRRFSESKEGGKESARRKMTEWEGTPLTLPDTCGKSPSP